MIDLETGLLEGASYCPSPNCNDRPPCTTIDLLVIHSIELPPQAWGSSVIHDLFCNTLDPKRYPFFEQEAKLEVSAHLLIDRQGTITQFVPFHRRAWHAGISNFQGKENCNNFSIGVELESGAGIPFEPVQYETLIDLIRVLQSAYPEITPSRIVGHADIAPGRKQDPGPLFDWNYVRYYME